MTRSLTLYVASPVTAYGTPHRGRALAGIRSEVGAGAVMLDPAVLFATDAEWLAEWPRLVRSLDMLVVVPATNRTVEAGVLREMSDALALCVPVSLWAPPRQLVPWAAFDVRGIPGGTAGMAAWVIPLDIPTGATTTDDGVKVTSR